MGKCFSKNTQSHDNNNIIQTEFDQTITKLSKMPVNYKILIPKIYGNIMDRYFIKNKISRLTNGKIYLLYFKELKCYRQMKKKKSCVERGLETKLIDDEIEILKELDHSSIIKIYEYYSRKDYIYMIKEYAENGDLASSLANKEKFTEDHACFIMKQIFSALCYIHKKKIVNYNIKPEKILLGQKDNNYHYIIKLDDFCSNEGDERDRSIYKYYEYDKESTDKVDMWNCGIILYNLLYGKLPFGAEENNRGDNKRIEFDESLNIQSDANNLIMNLLERDPSKRLSSCDAINNIWINRNSVKSENSLKSENIKLMYNLTDTLKNYKKGNILQKTALAYIIHNIQCEELTIIEKLFHFIDKDNEGMITSKNLEDTFSLLKSEIKTEELKNLVNLIIESADHKKGFIERKEFIRAFINRKNIFTDENLQFAFNFFDPNSLGFFTINELSLIFDKVDKVTLEQLFTFNYKNIKINRKGTQNKLIKNLKNDRYDFDDFKNLMMDFNNN